MSPAETAARPATGRWRRYAWVGVLAVIALVTWVSPLDQPATEGVEAGLKRAFVTFAAARGLNAAISVAQGTEFTFGVGASATFTVGEVLDPINDLVEQFANLMLLATVSFGIQEVLLAIGQHYSLKLVLTALVIACGVLYVYGRQRPGWLNSLLVLALMIRFAIPVATVGTEVLFHTFLEARYQASEQVIGDATQSVSELTPAPDGAADRERSWWDSTKDRLDPSKKLADLRQRAELAAEHMVRLIVVFLLETLIIPLALLWLLYVIVRSAITPAGRWSGGNARPGADSP